MTAQQTITAPSGARVDIIPDSELCAPEYALRSLDRMAGILTGYLAIWGSSNQRDCYNTWFDRAAPPELGLKYLPIPLFYAHGQDSGIGIQDIGAVVRAWVDNIGIGYEAHLDKSNPDYARVCADAEAGKLATSSASAGHLAKFDDQGRFVKWYLSEVSLTPKPCEPRMPRVVLRSLDGQNAEAVFESAIDVPTEDRGATPQPHSEADQTLTDATNEGLTMFPPANGAPAAAANSDPMAELSALVEQLGGVQAVMQLLSQSAAPAATLSDPAANGGATAPAAAAPVAPAAVAPVVPAPVAVAPVVPPAERPVTQAELTRALIGLMGQAPQPQTPVVRDRTAPAVVSEYTRAYDHMSTDDMVFAATTMSELVHSGRMRQPITERFVRSMNTRLAHEIQSNNAAFTRNMPERLSATRANELMGSTVVSAGDEWVGIQYDDRLWNKIRQNIIYQELISRGLVERVVPQGYESIKVLTEGADPTWYATGASVSEDATGQPQTKLNSSKPGTGKQDLTVAKLGAAIVIQTELDEDSLIPIMPQLRDMMDKSGQEIIESILINGDTVLTASTNINLIDGTPTAASLGGLPSYTLLDGFLKLALVTNTANSRDGGALDEDDYMETLKLMGTNGRDSIDPKNVVFIVDNMTYYKTLQLATLKTQDVFSGATIVNGQLDGIWGRKILVSGQMATANSAGKIPAAGAALGRILSVRPDRWTIGWKRRTTTEVQRWSRADATELVTYLRMGMVYFNNEASAVSYNLTV